MKHGTTGENLLDNTADDMDIPPLTDEQLSKMRPLREVHPELYEELTRGKTSITLRLDDEVIDWFRQRVMDAGGGLYTALINEALKEYIRGQKLEDTLRRVIREELRTAAP
jgi:uncharacterized protein (DUF4415 family)